MEEEARLEAKLQALGVDWSSGAAVGTPRPVVTVSPPPGKPLAAGETLPWTVTVENRGDGPMRRLRAWALADKAPLLDRREFVFGLVKPGEKRSWTVPLKLTRGIDSRHDEVKLHFEEENGRAPADAVTSLDVVEAPHSHAAADQAVEMVRRGKLHAIMKGALHTDELMAAVVREGTGLRTDRRISHVFVIDAPTYHKLLLVTDAAINIAPTRSQISRKPRKLPHKA